MVKLLTIAGLGPGASNMVTPNVQEAISSATDIVGYIPYVARIPPRDGLVLHASDNRVEIERAELALDLAASGKKVLIVSSGDPGVFAMAAAVFEILDKNPSRWADVEVQILPGITAMLAAAAKIGAPLGHDFCTLNLSDNLKPWGLIEKRLLLGIEADFAMALYNPRSKSRPEGFNKALTILKRECSKDRLIVFARAISTPEEKIQIMNLTQAKPEMADMQTVVIIGSSQTKALIQNGKTFAYTPRYSKLGSTN
ncbi:MAG: precorrin-3B C(17)-methyltransferase [Rhodobacterales bacterium]|nr:precorrin-3B C(17)-methyltransferase [Rhodobacterales bacterium]